MEAIRGSDKTEAFIAESDAQIAKLAAMGADALVLQILRSQHFAVSSSLRLTDSYRASVSEELVRLETENTKLRADLARAYQRVDDQTTSHATEMARAQDREAELSNQLSRIRASLQVVK